MAEPVDTSFIPKYWGFQGRKVGSCSTCPNHYSSATPPYSQLRITDQDRKGFHTLGVFLGRVPDALKRFASLKRISSLFTPCPQGNFPDANFPLKLQEKSESAELDFPNQPFPSGERGKGVFSPLQSNRTGRSTREPHTKCQNMF